MTIVSAPFNPRKGDSWHLQASRLVHIGAWDTGAVDQGNLRHAFYFTSFGEDDEERIIAARLDLFATVVLLVVLADATWGMFRLFPM